MAISACKIPHFLDLGIDSGAAKRMSFPLTLKSAWGGSPEGPIFCQIFKLLLLGRARGGFYVQSCTFISALEDAKVCRITHQIHLRLKIRIHELEAVSMLPCSAFSVFKSIRVLLDLRRKKTNRRYGR